MKFSATNLDALGTRLSLSSFEATLRSLIRQLWNGEIDEQNFQFSMQAAIADGYDRAWRAGESKCGIAPEDRTGEEDRLKRTMTAEAMDRIRDLAIFVLQHTQSPLSTILNRADIWTNGYNRMMEQAQALACGDQKFRWELGDTEKHCKSCLRYNGKVHRGSTWHAAGALPQSHSLECGGFLCDCRLVPTDAPASSGTLGAPSG